MTITTTLISGAGNTFHLVDDQGLILGEESRQKLAKNICSKYPADGLIFLKRDQNDFAWDFYNNDGSVAEMCGNATRCVGLFIHTMIDPAQSTWRLITKAGVIHIHCLSEITFEVTMTPISETKSTLGFFCNTGVPHLVVPLQNFSDYKDHFERAKTLRFHEEFQPQGTNVTYIEKESATRMRAVSYERGVENFTQACGTGAMAAAFYNLKMHGENETNVEMPGGTLIMNLQDLQKPRMTGPAIILGKYSYEF